VWVATLLNVRGIEIVGRASVVLTVLADDGFFPRSLARTHPRFGTPVVSLVAGGVVLTALCGLRFTQLTGAHSLVQCLVHLLIYAALFRLRRREAAGSGEGFRIPLGAPGLALLVAPSVVLVALVVATGLWHDGGLDARQAVLDAVILGSGPLTYALLKRRTARAA
jgi:amino acid transporter